MRRTILVVAVAAAVALGARPSTATAPPDVAPDITLTGLNGKALRIADLKGQVVLLDFWASWCVPCRRSFPAVDLLSRELGPKGVTTVAVNVDEVQRNAFTFLEKYPHTMTIAFDPAGTVAEAFHLQAMPSSLLIDRAGRVRFTHQGYTEKTISQFRTEALQLLAENE
jgi:thiol-disulfide isomerase/thioredoxin